MYSIIYIKAIKTIGVAFFCCICFCAFNPALFDSQFLIFILWGSARIQDSLWYKSSVWLDYIALSTWLNHFEMFLSKFDTWKEHLILYVQEKQCCSEWKTVLKENHVYIEKVRAYISQFSYTYVMMNMKLLSVVTPPSIYHGCSTWKALWDKRFTSE